MLAHAVFVVPTDWEQTAAAAEHLAAWACRKMSEDAISFVTDGNVVFLACLAGHMKATSEKKPGAGVCRDRKASEGAFVKVQAYLLARGGSGLRDGPPVAGEQRRGQARQGQGRGQPAAAGAP